MEHVERPGESQLALDEKKSAGPLSRRCHRAAARRLPLGQRCGQRRNIISNAPKSSKLRMTRLARVAVYSSAAGKWPSRSPATSTPPLSLRTCVNSGRCPARQLGVEGGSKLRILQRCHLQGAHRRGGTPPSQPLVGAPLREL